MHVLLLARVDQSVRRNNIVSFVILERCRPVDARLGCEMEDRVDIAHSFRQIVRREIDLKELQSGVARGLNIRTLAGRVVVAVEVIDPDDIVPRAEQMLRDVRSHKRSGSGDKS